MPPPPPAQAQELNQSEVQELVEAIEESKPVIVDIQAKESDSLKVMPPLPKSGIKVVALRLGFFKNCRKVEGDEFIVADMSKVGTWMKCVDPELEKQHQAMMKEKKAGN